MSRLTAYDCVYDSGEESGDDEEGEEDGEVWDEVDLGEILGVEGGFEKDDGIEIDTRDGASSYSEPSSLRAEALGAMQEMVDEDKKMMDVSTENSSPRASPIACESKPRAPSEAPQTEITANTTKKVDEPQAEKLTKHPKRKLQAEAPQSSKPAKRVRASVDPAKLVKELAETWRAEQAPIAPEVKETRIAVRIVGQRGTKSIKYKVQWAEAGDCSFPDSWVDEGVVVTREMVRVWEAPKSKKGKPKSKK